MVCLRSGRSCAKAFLFFAPLVVACAPQAGSAPRGASVRVGAEVSDETIRSIRQFVVMVSGDGAGDNGSGVVVSKQGREYTVFTNDHVLKPEARQQRIITPDGARHVFEVVRRDQAQKGLDLAVLKFSSDKEYPVAPLRAMADLEPGETVVVAGFPAVKNGQFVAHVGYLVGDGRKPFVLPPKDSCRFGEPPARGANAEGMSASEPASYNARDGYMLALCADQEKGMSGGATTDALGRVIGLSGRHSPLWSTEDDFSKNGNAQLSPEEVAVLEQFNWAIPVNLWGLSGFTGDRPWEPLW